MKRKHALAATATELVGGSEPPSEILLIPAGEVRTRPHDGRPAWRNPDPDAVVAATSALKLDLPIDYEHQKEHAKRNGQPAPASGWIKDVFARDGAVWGRVQWTERAAAMLRAGEYRFISAVFNYDPRTRRVQRVTGAGLVNDPALYMTAIAGAEPSTTEGDPEMDPKQVKALAKALGLAEDATAEQVLVAATASAAAIGTLKAVTKALGLEEGAEGAAIVTAAETAKASASADQPDPSKFVPRSEFDRVTSRLTDLETASAAGTATAAVDQAVKDGKVSPAQREWALGYATKDPEGFTAYAAAAPAILSDGRVAPTADPEGKTVLSAEEKAVCRAMGVSEKDYIASAKALAGEEVDDG